MYRIPQVFVDKYQETGSGKRYGFGTVVSPSSAVGLVAWGSRRFSLAAFKILAIRSVLDSPCMVLFGDGLQDLHQIHRWKQHELSCWHSQHWTWFQGMVLPEQS